MIESTEAVSSVGEKIRVARGAANLTQEQLAQRIGVTRGAVAQWESNTTRPRMESVIKLAAATGSSFDWLYGGESLPARVRAKERKVGVFSGWQCPGCLKMYSPLVQECPRC
jgi:transcriptional regulator with XRE-family HTH domain